MEVFKSGTQVKIIQSGIEGIIKATTIRFNNVIYEVDYWLQGEIKTCYLNEIEFESKSKPNNQIGFKI